MSQLFRTDDCVQQDKAKLKAFLDAAVLPVIMKEDKSKDEIRATLEALNCYTDALASSYFWTGKRWLKMR